MSGSRICFRVILSVAGMQAGALSPEALEKKEKKLYKKEQSEV